MIYRMCAAALALAISATVASAGVTTYTDRGLWEGALAGFNIINTRSTMTSQLLTASHSVRG